jgi:hypothetical protein
MAPNPVFYLEAFYCSFFRLHAVALRSRSHGINAFAPHDIRTSEKAFDSRQKAGLFDNDQWNALYDYRKITQNDFSFVQVSSLDTIFYYKSTLVIWNRFLSLGIVLRYYFYLRINILNYF